MEALRFRAANALGQFIEVLSGHARGERRFFSNRLNILSGVALFQNFLPRYARQSPPIWNVFIALSNELCLDFPHYRLFFVASLGPEEFERCHRKRHVSNRKKHSRDDKPKQEGSHRSVLFAEATLSTESGAGVAHSSKAAEAKRWLAKFG